MAWSCGRGEVALMTPEASALLQRLIGRVLDAGGNLDQRCVYLLHFDTPLRHARHYLGVTRRGLGTRLVEHYAGRGSRLMAAVVAAGIEVRLVRTWPAGRSRERALKRWKKNPALCPLCRQTLGAVASIGLVPDQPSGSARCHSTGPSEATTRP
jgi:predicted GIY-YIG superfamily endonuclease